MQFSIKFGTGMIYKLQQSGILGELLNILIDFLNNRKHKVVLNGQNSNWAEDRAGGPQGLIMGLLLCLIYINHLPEDLNNKVKLFADDIYFFRLFRKLKNSIMT